MTTKTVDELLVELDDKKLADSIELAKGKSDDERPPFTEAHVVILEGEMRSGKTCTATARVVDAYYEDCVRIFCKTMFKVICEVKWYNRKTREARIKFNGGFRKIRIPEDYKLHSPMRIFCNYHLYGIPYTFLPSFSHTLAWIKQGIIINAWLIMDEAYVGLNARASMRDLGRAFANTYQQFAKMQLDVIIITPMSRQIDWIARTIPTEHTSCSYNKKTRKITLTTRKKGVSGEHKFDYDATQYWKFFKTNETIVQ